MSHYPILGRFLSQFEASIGRRETVGPGALRDIGGGVRREGKGRAGGGGAKHSARVVKTRTRL